MLEQAENSFESSMLDTISSAESLMPKLIAERVLMATFQKRSCLKTQHQKFFTKKRLQNFGYRRFLEIL